MVEKQTKEVGAQKHAEIKAKARKDMGKMIGMARPAVAGEQKVPGRMTRKMARQWEHGRTGTAIQNQWENGRTGKDLRRLPVLI